MQQLLVDCNSTRGILAWRFNSHLAHAAVASYNQVANTQQAQALVQCFTPQLIKHGAC